MQLVSLSDREVMLVAVLSNGTVENVTFEREPEVSDVVVDAASALLARHGTGSSLTELGDVALPAAPDGDDPIAKLARRGLEELRARTQRPDDHLYIGGTASVASAFDAVDVVRNVLVTLEQEYVVVSLIRDMLDRGVTVAIGTEHGVEQLAACSVVVAPYVVEGEAIGTVGLLGSDTHELPAGSGRRRRREPAPRRAPVRGIAAVASGRQWPRTSTRCWASVPTPPPRTSSGRTASGARAPPRTPTRATPGPRSGSRRCPGAYEVLSDPEQRVGTTASVRPVSPASARGTGLLLRWWWRARRPVRRVLRRQPVRRRLLRPDGPPRGQDLEVEEHISFEEAVFGTTLPVTVRTAVRCEHCDGIGAEPGTQPVTCSECRGRDRSGGCARVSSARWSPRRRARAAAAWAR